MGNASFRFESPGEVKMRSLPNVLPISMNNLGFVECKKISEEASALRCIRFYLEMTQSEFAQEFGEELQRDDYHGPTTATAISMRERGQYMDYSQLQRLTRRIFGADVKNLFPLIERKERAKLRKAKRRQKVAKDAEKLLREHFPNSSFVLDCISHEE